MVLVDSASTDSTRQIASDLGVRIIALPKTVPLSASAGRFVGFHATRSEIVFFVDGDFVVEPAWLCRGLSVLHEQMAAAVCGVDREVSEAKSAISRYVDELSRRAIPKEETVEVDAIPVGLYRRDWIERAGGIQPFLKGAEDRDLAFRIRALGGRLVKTRDVMGYHHWSPGTDLTLPEYLKSVGWWSYGEGQAARFGWNHRSLRGQYLRRYFNARHLIQLEYGLIFFVWIVAILAGAASGLYGMSLGVLLALPTAFLIYSRLRGEPFRTSLFRLHTVPYVVIRLAAFAVGFVRKPQPASTYPLESLRLA